MNIYLCKMTKAKMHEFYRAFSYDPSAMSENDNSRYIYDTSTVDAYFEKHMLQGKIHFAIMLGDTVIGDVYLHVLEKVGFTEIRRDSQSIYYEYRKSNWNRL